MILLYTRRAKRAVDMIELLGELIKINKNDIIVYEASKASH